MSYQINAVAEWAGSYSKMSLPERLFNKEGYLLLRDYIDSNIQIMLYEHISFNVPGGRYTPDFFIIFEDGRVAFVEVKQASISRKGKKYYAGTSYRDSRSKLRASAEINPWFRFFQATYIKGGWDIELIVPERGFEGVSPPAN